MLLPMIYMRIMSLCLLATLTLEAGAPPTLQKTALDELQVLINSTEALVQKQKALLQLLQEYLNLHDAYLKDTENRELLLKTAKIASQALETIKKERLSYLFEPSFLSEMTLFAKLAGRPSIPKPP
jgi:hypothetical protein